MSAYTKYLIREARRAKVFKQIMHTLEHRGMRLSNQDQDNIVLLLAGELKFKSKLLKGKRK